MEFTYESPGWSAEGQEPDELKSTGWQPNQKPPAGIFNWFWTRVSNCLTELQNKLATHQHHVDDVNGVLPIEKGGTGYTNSVDALAALNGLSKPISVTSGNHDLNAYTNTGFWYFSTGATLVNAPASANNGWLLVTRGATGIAKQYWSRQGSSSNYHQCYMRLATSSASDTTWNDWAKFYTSADTVPVANGGTGATTASAARTALGAAASSHTHVVGDITSGTLPINRGGTGATTAKAAREALGAEPEITVTNVSVSTAFTRDTSKSSAVSGSIKYVGKRVIGYLELTDVVVGSSCQVNVGKLAKNPIVMATIGGQAKRSGVYGRISGYIHSSAGNVFLVTQESGTYDTILITFDFFCG